MKRTTLSLDMGLHGTVLFYVLRWGDRVLRIKSSPKEARKKAIKTDVVRTHKTKKGE